MQVMKAMWFEQEIRKLCIFKGYISTKQLQMPYWIVI